MASSEVREVRIAPSVVEAMVAHARACLPEEACGMLAGPSGTEVTVVFPVENDAHSAILYSVNPRGHLRADRAAEKQGLAINGVFHSHTHSEAYPSPTDVAQAPDPSWLYVLVSLRDAEPVVRCFTIEDGTIREDELA